MDRENIPSSGGYLKPRRFLASKYPVTHVDHIIVGGGIIGCSIAYHLVCEGAGSVLVLERNELASAASSRAAGLILQATTKSSKTALTQLTRETIPRLEDELSEDIGFHAVGSLRIAASDQYMTELQAMERDASERNIPSQRLTLRQATAMAPWLKPPNDSDILYMPSDGYVDPYQLSMAYARAARRRGAKIRTQIAVTGLLMENHRVIGVATSGGNISANTVIDAAGVWAALLAAQAGYPLPFAPVRSHYWIAEPAPLYGGDHPVTVMPDAAAYTRPEIGGLVLGIQEPDCKTFDARDLPDDPNAFSATEGEEHWDILVDGINAIQPFFPDVMTSRFSNYISGLSAYTPDGAIILGPVPGVSGFLCAAGCCGSGVALSAGIGAAITDLALEREPSFDIAPFDPGRFGSVDPFCSNFREQCAAARSAKSRLLPAPAVTSTLQA
jgi:sarcosine oxidase, subunit beta